MSTQSTLAAQSAAAVKALWLHRPEPGAGLVDVHYVLGDVAELAIYLPSIVERIHAQLVALDDPRLAVALDALALAATSARHVAQDLDDALDITGRNRSHEPPAPRAAPPARRHPQRPAPSLRHE